VAATRATLKVAFIVTLLYMFICSLSFLVGSIALASVNRTRFCQPRSLLFNASVNHSWPLYLLTITHSSLSPISSPYQADGFRLVAGKHAGTFVAQL
jgi:hypothetical protein